MHSMRWWPTLIVLAIATFTDLHSRRIPNWLVLPFMLAGIVVSGWLHGWSGIGQSRSGLGLVELLLDGLSWLCGLVLCYPQLCGSIGALLVLLQCLFPL